MQSRQRQAQTAHRHPLALLGAALLGVALLLPAAPAQASEVVKLARLLITGKRSPAVRQPPSLRFPTAAPTAPPNRKAAPPTVTCMRKPSGAAPKARSSRWTDHTGSAPGAGPGQAAPRLTSLRRAFDHRRPRMQARHRERIDVATLAKRETA